MSDRFSNTQPTLSAPATSGFAITPSDSIDAPETTRALYVGGSGHLSVRMLSGETVTFTNVSAGCLLPLRVTRVLLTGTTATSITGLV